jgi:HEPN domain-containing protein
MPGTDEALAVAGAWAKKADNDLTLAAHALKLGKNCPADMVCFHAQQCVEK